MANQNCVVLIYIYIFLIGPKTERKPYSPRPFFHFRSLAQTEQPHHHSSSSPSSNPSDHRRSCLSSAGDNTTPPNSSGGDPTAAAAAPNGFFVTLLSCLRFTFFFGLFFQQLLKPSHGSRNRGISQPLLLLFTRACHCSLKSEPVR